jgi:hypothetical protein
MKLKFRGTGDAAEDLGAKLLHDIDRSSLLILDQRMVAVSKK